MFQNSLDLQCDFFMLLDSIYSVINSSKQIGCVPKHLVVF
jgi:hypothetical protein